MTLAPPTWTLQKTYEYFAVSNVNVKKARELKNTGNFSWAKTENGKCFTRSEACCGDVLPLRQVKKKEKEYVSIKIDRGKQDKQKNCCWQILGNFT